MKYLLDTNVISEFASPNPNPSVFGWFHERQNDELYLSVITIGEIQQGISRLPESKKQSELNGWLYDTLLVAYADFILPIETTTMLQWGMLTAQLMQQGNKMPVMDAMIAATALEHNLALATRNTADFVNAGVELLNPWHAKPL